MSALGSILSDGGGVAATEEWLPDTAQVAGLPASLRDTRTEFLLRGMVDLDLRASIAALELAEHLNAIDPSRFFTLEPGEDYHEAIDRLEVAMMAYPAQEFTWDHTFTPGLYRRTIRMPAGSLLTSRIHKTEHQYAVLQGAVSVLTEDLGWVRIEAPYMGITKPGTRRLLFVHRDTLWTTFHATNKTDHEAIIAEITEFRTAHLAGLRQPGSPPLQASVTGVLL